MSDSERATKICPGCGIILDRDAAVCPRCRTTQPDAPKGAAPVLSGQRASGRGSRRFAASSEAHALATAAAAPALAEAVSSPRRLLVAFLLCFFLGPLGIHRFYAGKPGTAVLQLLTAGGLGVWWLIDLVMLLAGGFRDGQGLRITEWT